MRRRRTTGWEFLDLSAPVMYCRVWSRVRRRRRRFGWGREREKHGEEQDEEGYAQEQMHQHRSPSRPPSPRARLRSAAVSLILKHVHGLQRIRVCSCGSLVFLGVWHDHPGGRPLLVSIPMLFHGEAAPAGVNKCLRAPILRVKIYLNLSKHLQYCLLNSCGSDELLGNGGAGSA